MAALQFWRRELEENDDYPDEEWDIASSAGAYDPLTVDEIEALYDKFNN